MGVVLFIMVQNEHIFSLRKIPRTWYSTPSPICQKDRLPLSPLPHAATRQTLTQHTRTIGMDHVTVTPHDEDGYVASSVILPRPRGGSNPRPSHKSVGALTSRPRRHWCMSRRETCVVPSNYIPHYFFSLGSWASSRVSHAS
jgi:hypothetical protein